MKISKKMLIGIAAFSAVVGALLLAPVQAQPSRQAQCTFSGVWSTTHGQMALEQSGTSVSGTYSTGSKRVEGAVQGDVLTGAWSQPPTYSAANNQAGDIEFQIAPDCETFTGTWRYGSSGAWSGAWEGSLSLRGEGVQQPAREGHTNHL